METAERLEYEGRNAVHAGQTPGRPRQTGSGARKSPWEAVTMVARARL